MGLNYKVISDSKYQERAVKTSMEIISKLFFAFQKTMTGISESISNN